MSGHRPQHRHRPCGGRPTGCRPHRPRREEVPALPWCLPFGGTDPLPEGYGVGRAILALGRDIEGTYLRLSPGLCAFVPLAAPNTTSIGDMGVARNHDCQRDDSLHGIFRWRWFPGDLSAGIGEGTA